MRLGFGVTTMGPVLVFKVMAPPPRGEAGDSCVAGVEGEANFFVKKEKLKSLISTMMTN